MKALILLLLSSLPAFAQCDFNGKKYDANLRAGEFRPLCHFAFVNHGKGVMAGIQIDTDSDAVDTAAAIRIENSGRSDAIWIGVKGKAGQPSRPSGIGIDMNRGAGDRENSAQMNGFALNIWDWSETDQGLNGPAAIYVQKLHNLNSGHRALWILSNQSAITLETRNVPGYDGARALIDVTDGRTQKFKLSADGDVYAHSAGWGGGRTISSSSTIAQYVGTLMTSAQAQDSISVSAVSHCHAQPTNEQAALMPQWVSVLGSVIVLHHSALAGASFDIFCSFH